MKQENSTISAVCGHVGCTLQQFRTANIDVGLAPRFYKFRVKSSAHDEKKLFVMIMYYEESLNIMSLLVNTLSPNSGLSQISHCSIKGLLVREVMRTENMISLKLNYLNNYVNSFSQLLLY